MTNQGLSGHGMGTGDANVTANAKSDVNANTKSNVNVNANVNVNIPDDEDFSAEYGSGGIKSMILSQLVPEEYLYDPIHAEPALDNLRVAAQQYAEDTNVDNLNNTNVPGSTHLGLGLDPSFQDDGLGMGMGMGLTSPTSISGGIGSNGSVMQEDAALSALLKAAEKDVVTHMSRVKAVLAQDPSLLESYSPQDDIAMQERTQRLDKMEKRRETLQSQSRDILFNLNDNIDFDSPSKKKKENFTQAQILEKKLKTWEKALQLYIYSNSGDDSNISGGNGGVNAGGTAGVSSSSNSQHKQKAPLTLIQLLQHLCLTSGKDDEQETLTSALEQATQMCNTQLEQTSKLLQDSVEQTADTFQSYHIHLMAHSIAAQNTLKQTSDVQAKFLHHGKEALKIGHALEVAEAKRRQSEQASTLLKRWWMMENLAIQEKQNPINVEDEVGGRLASGSCMMDPLFTRPENSLEAAKTLKSLRLVVKCRSGSASGNRSSSGDANGGMSGNNSNSGNTDAEMLKERFEQTDGLIKRTSAALEERLLERFGTLYTAGGNYDFSSLKNAKRPGRLDWVMLREVAEALMSFDSGRSLHKKYVHLVVQTKFPELNNVLDGGDGDEEKFADEDIDGTRSKLSGLFHRVCEVCTEEFQLIAHIFSSALPQHLQQSPMSNNGKKARGVHSSSSFPQSFALQVARTLLQRLISDSKNGMQAQINGLLESVDRRGDFDSGIKKLDTFVIIHEKAAGLFSLLKDAARNMWVGAIPSNMVSNEIDPSVESLGGTYNSNAHSASALIQFLTTQELSLSNGQRRGYLNLELRLLHHHCCANLDRSGGKLLRPIRTKEDSVRNTVGSGGLADYRAPIMPLDQEHIKKSGFLALLNGPLKQAVYRQPLIHAADSLARARLMFGSVARGGDEVDSTARVISTIFSQMCNFYGPSYLYPVIDSLGNMLASNPPSSAPMLPFDEAAPPHNLGVDKHFWIIVDRIHAASKSFDRELWAENRTGSMRVWEILVQTRSQTSLTLAKERRIHFFQELEERGEAIILKALDVLSNHIHWILVTGGESLAKLGSGNRRDGPYAVPSGSILDSTNSPSVKALTFCLRAQFISIQTALTPQSLSAFWTSLSRRLYDILVTRLLQNYKVSTVGAVVLSRDVEALRSVSMLAGTDHSHWDTLRELLTLYMTPPDSLKTMLVGAEGDITSGKGMFGRVGKEQSIVFMSRRIDYRYRTNQGTKKSRWASELLEELGVNDPTDGRVNITNFAAENIAEKQ